MATYRSPAVALMPDVTPKPLRSKANAIINLMGAVGGIIMLLAIKVMVPKSSHPDYIPLFILTIVIMLLSVGFLFFKVNEPKTVAQMEAESRAMGVAEEPAAQPVADQRAERLSGDHAQLRRQVLHQHRHQARQD